MSSETPLDAAAELRAATRLVAIDLPAECVPGVRANLDLLREHFANVEAFEIPDASE